jgi:hypothetical protein
MSRDRWLGKIEDLYQIANAQFIPLQQMQNPQANRVGERPEHEIDSILRWGRHALAIFA